MTKGPRSFLTATVMILACASGATLTVEGAEVESSSVEGRQNSEYDVIVYGGTSGGVVAAVQAASMGKSVLLIEPGRHIGGLSSGGLGATDIGNKAAIGGLSRAFYRSLGTHYADENAWVHESPGDFAKNSRSRPSGKQEMWKFEPHVAEKTFQNMLAAKKVPIRYDTRLDLQSGVELDGSRIDSIVMEGGSRFRAKVFIDATYEGDLMALAGISYHVGREANATYGETLNGVQTINAVHHQFTVPVDPYRRRGDPSSGLLPGVAAGGPGDEGAGDHRVQAYCFRMCTTDVVENRVPWKKPDGYNAERYELLLRNFEAGDHRVPWNPLLMPNRKTDVNNNYAISTDNIGMNYDYPDADYVRREEIIHEHLVYQQGLMWTLANHSRVPEKIRNQFQLWGPAKDEFVDNDHWPHQLYIREARRMISDYVMTQHECQGRRTVDDAVGLAAYTMDSHNIQRYVKDGQAINEGDVQVGGFSPYAISYRSIRPKKAECSNLLVPVCLSASHIAYGSIRMEPVFMVLGQSAATAACLAIDADVAVQDVSYSSLRERMLADGQILEWTGPKRLPPLDPKTMPGIVVDDRDAELTGTWTPSRSVGNYVGTAYLHDKNENKGAMRAVFRPKFSRVGRYEVRVYYTPNPNRATNVPVTVESSSGAVERRLDQRRRAGKRGFVSIGTYEFAAGRSGSVTISNAKTDGHVIIDAVQFVRVDEPGK